MGLKMNGHTRKWIVYHQIHSRLITEGDSDVVTNRKYKEQQKTCTSSL